ncbi:MAG: TrmH family RNA methyltransferase [Dehalococcoidia bacterium]
MLISSRANERVKAIRALQERKARDQSGTFFAEGTRVLRAALETGAVIEQVVVCEERLTEDDAAVANELASRDLPILEVTGPVFDAISFREEGQSLGAVVRQNWETLTRETKGKRCWVALHDIGHPGNLGTIVRCNDAIGGDGVILSGTTTDPYHPIAVRGSLAAVFTQRIVRSSPADLARWARDSGCLVVGTSPYGNVDFREPDYTQRPVLLIGGSERIGISEEQIALCDAVVRIPMHGYVESLNLSIATALVLYEIERQRSAAG